MLLAVATINDLKEYKINCGQVLADASIHFRFWQLDAFNFVAKRIEFAAVPKFTSRIICRRTSNYSRHKHEFAVLLFFYSAALLRL